MGSCCLKFNWCPFPVHGGHDEHTWQSCHWKNAWFQSIQCSSLWNSSTRAYRVQSCTYSEFFIPHLLPHRVLCSLSPGGHWGCAEGIVHSKQITKCMVKKNQQSYKFVPLAAELLTVHKGPGHHTLILLALGRRGTPWSVLLCQVTSQVVTFKDSHCCHEHDAGCGVDKRHPCPRLSLQRIVVITGLYDEWYRRCQLWL